MQNNKDKFFYRLFIRNQHIWLNVLLFLFTFVSCMISGVAFIGNKDPFDLLNINLGLEYALLLMIFLSAHEFGHYFAAKYHKIDTTLPYYIPFPPTPLFPISFGTMGAVIRIKQQIPNKKALFDIGVAGPIAGFIVCLAYLIYGSMTLPGIDYLYNIHPNYVQEGLEVNGLYFGDNLLFYITKLLINKDTFYPPYNEIYHYPFLNVAWFGMFVTSLNMLPLGQLDGGHITYAMFGNLQHKIGKVFWWFILILGIGSTFKLFENVLINYNIELINIISLNFYNSLLNFTNSIIRNFPYIVNGWNGWFLWAIITKFFIKIPHPVIEDEESIGKMRLFIGLISLIILVLCFSYNGLYFLPYQMY